MQERDSKGYLRKQGRLEADTRCWNNPAFQAHPELCSHLRKETDRCISRQVSVKDGTELLY